MNNKIEDKNLTLQFTMNTKVNKSSELAEHAGYWKLIIQKSIQEVKTKYASLKTPLEHFNGVMETASECDIISQDYLDALIILFTFNQTKDLKESVPMVSKSKRVRNVRTNPCSGNFYLMERWGEIVAAMYVGEEILNFKDSEGFEFYSFFFVLGDDGISFWPDITFDKIRSSLYLIHTIVPKKLCLDPLSITNVDGEKIFENMESFADCTLCCKDGKLRTSKLLLAQKSPFFFTLFAKYNNGNVFATHGNEIPINFNSNVVYEFLRYALCGKVDLEKIQDNVIDCLIFGDFIQDTGFVKVVYELAFDLIESEEEKETLNEHVSLVIINK